MRWCFFALLFLGLLAIGLMYEIPSWAAKGKLWDGAAGVEGEPRVAVVFGTTAQVQGRENLYFRYRMDAAYELWRAGKVTKILVSGDNREIYYNEPQKMKQALVQRGVPEEVIVQDFAGLRTLDTVVRAQKIFGLTRVIFISQKFHNERALFLARHIGLDARGLNAKDVENRMSRWKIFGREVLARGKMFLDLYVLDTKPTHMGEPIPMDGKSDGERNEWRD